MITQNFKYFLTIIIIGAVATIYQIQLTRLQEKLIYLDVTKCNPKPSYDFRLNNATANLFLTPTDPEEIEILLRKTTRKPAAESSYVRYKQQNAADFHKTKSNDPNDKLVVLYNRVPKTGSTSFVGIAYDLCKKNEYHVLHVNITANSHVLSLNNQVSFVKNVTEWAEMKPALYHGHFAFTDFSKFGVPKPLFINLIRRPLDRFISYYYFVRYGDNFRPYLVRRKAGNTMTFDECVQKGLPECDPNAMWLQVPFFCGHAANCWKPGNKWALTEAKKNLVNNYFLVGVTEELEDFIAILEISLPRFFKGAMDHYTHSNKSHLRQTVQKDLPSEETIKKIKLSTVWQMENELYEFALDNFHFAKKHTLRNRLQNVMYEKIRPRQS